MRLAKRRYTKELFSERAIGDKPSLVTVADDYEQSAYVAEQILRNRETG